MTWGLKVRVKTCSLERMQGKSTPVSIFFFFLHKNKNKAHTHWHAHTNTKWFVLLSPLFFFCMFFFFYLFHHSHFDWQFTRGGNCIPARQTVLLLARQDTPEKKGSWEKRGVRFRHHWITSLYVPAGCFHTSPSHSSRNVSDTNSERRLFILILTHS